MSLTSLIQDVRYASRVYRRRPAFAVAALLVLSLGIGGCAMIFSVVETVLLHPLDYPEPERLVRLREHNFAKGVANMSTSPANFVDYWREAHSFTHMGVFRDETGALTVGDAPERVNVGLISGSFFEVLGVPAAYGTTISTEPGVAAERKVLVLSYVLWTRGFGADPSVIGTTVDLDGDVYTVVGVMPKWFEFLGSPELWRPLGLDGDQWAGRDARYLRVVARLAPGASLTEAQREMELLSERLAREHPANEGWSTVVNSLEAEVTENIRPAMLVLLAASALLLVVSCINVMNLLLAGAASRTHEVATRLALGAGTGRLIRQLFTESVMLTLAAGICGLVLAGIGNRILVRSIPNLALRWSEIGIDARVVFATFGLALGCGVVVAVAPALRLVSAELRPSMANAESSMGLRRDRLSRVFSGTQIAISFVLLVVAGLLIRSYHQLTQVDPGFDSDNVVSLRVELPENVFREEVLRAEFYRHALERLRAIPGVEEAGAVSSLPLSGSTTYMRFEIPGRAPTDRDFAPFYAVTPGYFETMRMPLRSGRYFEERDRTAVRSAVIVNEAMARQLFAGDEAVGKTIDMDITGETSYRVIVGVVANVRNQALELDGAAVMYGLYEQAPYAAMSLCLRTSADPLGVVPAARRALAEVDPRVPVGSIATADDLLWDSTSHRRLILGVTMVFAAFTLILALVGIYAVLSHAVSRTTRELGVRLTLGAQRRDIRRLITSYALSVILPGLAFGLLAANFGSGLIASQLFGVEGSDVPTYVFASAMVSTMALVACQAPARRASRVDAAVALRHE